MVESDWYRFYDPRDFTISLNDLAEARRAEARIQQGG